MFTIKDDYASVIISIDSEEVSNKELICLKSYLWKCDSSKRFAINLKNVKSVNNEFFSFVKEFSCKRKLSIFSASTSINALLFIMNYGQYTDLYINEEDFLSSKRELVNRNFRFCTG